MAARELEEIKPVYEEEARIQIKWGGSGGKQGRVETAARVKGNAKSVFVLSLTRFKGIKTFRIRATSELFHTQVLNFSCYLIPNVTLLNSKSHSYSLEEQLKDLERVFRNLFYVQPIFARQGCHKPHKHQLQTPVYRTIFESSTKLTQRNTLPPRYPVRTTY
jgi:hypothetical protein